MKSKKSEQPKKPFYKKTWFIVLVALIVIGGVSNMINGGSDSDPAGSALSQTSEVLAHTSEIIANASEAVSAESSSAREWQGEDLVIQKVRNDKTGKWRVAVVSSGTPQDQYAYEYYQRYMKDDPSYNNLFIVNLGLKTTTGIFNSEATGQIDVTVHEYVDGEEHDAVLLNSGMDLEQTKILSASTGEVLMEQ